MERAQLVALVAGQLLAGRAPVGREGDLDRAPITQGGCASAVKTARYLVSLAEQAEGSTVESTRTVERTRVTESESVEVG